MMTRAPMTVVLLLAGACTPKTPEKTFSNEKEITVHWPRVTVSTWSESVENPTSSGYTIDEHGHFIRLDAGLHGARRCTGVTAPNDNALYPTAEEIRARRGFEGTDPRAAKDMAARYQPGLIDEPWLVVFEPGRGAARYPTSVDDYKRLRDLATDLHRRLECKSAPKKD